MHSENSHRLIVFCDFDGTITAEETFIEMLKIFASGLYGEVASDLRGSRTNIRRGIRRLLESIPSRRYPEILEFIREKEVRPGFQEFLDRLEEKGVPLVVISGGLVGMVKTRLDGLLSRIHGVHAADVETGGPFLRVVSDWEEGDELVAKAKVMARYGFRQSVAIGNGLTDLNMALSASVVYARDGLPRYLEERGRPYRSWEDFHEIRESMADLLDGGR